MAVGYSQVSNAISEGLRHKTKTIRVFIRFDAGAAKFRRNAKANASIAPAEWWFPEVIFDRTGLQQKTEKHTHRHRPNPTSSVFSMRTNITNIGACLRGQSSVTTTRRAPHWIHYIKPHHNMDAKRYVRQRFHPELARFVGTSSPSRVIAFHHHHNNNTRM